MKPYPYLFAVAALSAALAHAHLLPPAQAMLDFLGKEGWRYLPNSR